MNLFLVLLISVHVHASQMNCIFDPFDERCVSFKLESKTSQRMLDNACVSSSNPIPLSCILNAGCKNETLGKNSLYCDPFSLLVETCSTNIDCKSNYKITYK